MDRNTEYLLRIVALSALALGCLLVLQPFVTALLGAAIVCFSTWPVYQYAEQKLHGNRTFAALLMTIALVLLMVLPLMFLASTLSDSITYAVDWARATLAEGAPALPDWVKNLPMVGGYLDQNWNELVASREKLEALTIKLMPAVQQGAIKFAVMLGEGVVQLSLVAFLAFFFYRDGKALIAWLRSILPRVAGTIAPELLEIVGGTTRSVVYGIVGTAIIQGIVAAIGFLIAGVPAAALLGFLTFILSMAPVGPPLVWIGATVWLAYQHEIGWAIFMAVYGFFAISGVDNVIKPILISRGSSLPFVLVFVGALGGAVAFGFIGIFLGPTLLAVGYALMRHWAQSERPTSPEG